MYDLVSGHAGIWGKWDGMTHGQTGNAEWSVRRVHWFETALTQLCQFTVESWSRDFHEKTQNNPGSNVARHERCCHDQPTTRLPKNMPRQAQMAIHQLRVNRLTTTASYQVLIDQCACPICPHCGEEEETAEHLLSCCRWEAESQHHFGESTDITNVSEDYASLMDFLISLGHLSTHIGTAWEARYDDNDNNSLAKLIRWGNFHDMRLCYAWKWFTVPHSIIRMVILAATLCSKLVSFTCKLFHTLAFCLI